MTNPLETRPNQVPPRRRRNIGETIEWYHSTIVARIHRLFAAAALCGQWRGFNRRFPISGAPVERDESRRQHTVPCHHLRRGDPRIAAAVRVGAEHRDHRSGVVGLRASAARRLNHAVRPVRLRARPDLHRPRQQPAVHRLRHDLDQRARLRPSQAAADPAVRRRRVLARRLPAADR